MSKITKGQVVIKVTDEDGEEQELVLKPTLKAATQISNRFGGFVPAMQALGKMDMQACVFIVIQGTNAKDADAKALPEKLWAAGLNDVSVKCLEFIRFLMNGGKGGKGDEEGEGAEGNAAA